MPYRFYTVARWTALLACAIACSPPAASVHLEYAAVTPDVVGAPAAAYFTVRVEGDREDSIVALSSDAAQAVSMHTPQPHRAPVGGATASAMLMPIPAVPLSPSGTARFTPGGYTALLFGLRQPLRLGDSIELTIRLASGRSASAVAPVLAFDALETTLDPASVASRPTSAPTAADGERLYRSNGCVGCHGMAGRGDGEVGRTLVPPPRDFRMVEAFKNGTSAVSIARTLAVGIPAGGSMPLYAHLSNHERMALALYLLSFRTSTSDRSTTP